MQRENTCVFLENCGTNAAPQSGSTKLEPFLQRTNKGAIAVDFAYAMLEKTWSVPEVSYGQRRLSTRLSFSSVTTKRLLFECRSMPQNFISASLCRKQSSHLAFYSTASQRWEAG